MKYIERFENIEREYQVFYDREELLRIRNELVARLSYKEIGTFDIVGRLDDENTIKDGERLPNGEQKYEIEKITHRELKKIGSYYDIKIQGKKTTSPQLAYIINDILDERTNSCLYNFINYETNDELLPIDKKIFNTNREIDRISNFDYDEKIGALRKLKRLCEDKENNRYFDIDLLKQYYLQACSKIELQLISEKVIKNSNRILLKDYKKTNR